MTDQDGYGYTRADRGVARLLEDLRTLSPAGIERIAEGWDRHVGDEGPAHELFHRAEKAALAAVEAAQQTVAWDDLRREILKLTEGPVAMNDWKAEHGTIGHKAERAVLAAALALTVEDRLPAADYAILVAPAAEALPWLLRT
jgi:hypothetical protein